MQPPEAGASQPQEQPKDQASQLIELMRGTYESLSRGDLSVIDALVSRETDILVIGTDAREWWRTADDFVRAAKKQAEELGVGAGLGVRPGDDLHARVEGGIGWLADRPTLFLPDGREIPTRLTVVFRQEAGQWKLVQWHQSLGVDNTADASARRRLTI
jgi:ketosteroid isomerase-like protein